MSRSRECGSANASTLKRTQGTQLVGRQLLGELLHQLCVLGGRLDLSEVAILQLQSL